MVFKPFRPPLIRKLQSTLPATSTDDNQSHPPKRRRVGDDNGNDDDDEENLPEEVNKGNARSTSTAGSRYVPLMQAKNTKLGGKELLSDIEVLEVDGDGGGDDVDASHFNVLWFVCRSPKFPSILLISVLYLGEGKCTKCASNIGGNSPLRSTKPGMVMESSLFAVGMPICEILPATIWDGLCSTQHWNLG